MTLKRVLSLFLLLCLLSAPLSSCKNAGGGNAGTGEGSGEGTGGETGLPVPSDIEYVELPVEVYKDKTTAGFLGELVGFLSGYEFVYSGSSPYVAMPDAWFELINGPYANPNPHKKHADKLLPNESTGKMEVWMDDDYSIDILNQYILRDMYKNFGRITSKVITDDWVNYNVYDMGGGHRSAGAYGLMKNNDLLPEFAGAWEFGNRYSYCYEPAIENETLGMVTAGMPDAASDLTDLFARVTGDQDAVLWAKFFATLYAMAYLESDIPTMIREARKLVPDNCVGQTVDGVFQLVEKYPENWRLAAREAVRTFGRHRDRMVSDIMLEPSVNSAFVLIALLYGGGDYLETCKIISLAGYDGDSSGAICMGLMGVLCGMEELPEKVNELVWQDGDGVIINKEIEGAATGYWMCMKNLPTKMPIADIVDLYQENFEHILVECGGKIENGVYYIPKREVGEVSTVWYEDFENGGFENFTVSGGKAETFSDGYEGDKTAKLYASSEGESRMVTEISGLTVGQTYRVSCYVSTSPTTCLAKVFVRAPGEEGVYASVCTMPRYILRRFTFTATAERMEFGLEIAAGASEDSFATLDSITICRVSENKAENEVKILSTEAADGGGYKGKLELSVSGTSPHEALLKLTFANPGSAVVNGKLTVNRVSFHTAPFYRTGEASENTRDAVYLPILLTEGENLVTLTFGSGTLHILSAEIVSLNERR